MTRVRRTAVLSSDTSLDAERLQVEIWRRMSPVEKVRVLTDITRAVQELTLAGIRLRHPGATDRECALRLTVLKLGRPLAGRAYPEVTHLSDH
jgi:hypothetical protein